MVDIAQGVQRIQSRALDILTLRLVAAHIDAFQPPQLSTLAGNISWVKPIEMVPMQTLA